MYAQRKSVKSKVSISGVGLHSGIYTRVAIHPAPAGSGITFVRVVHASDAPRIYEAALKYIPNADLAAFHDKYYRPNNAMLAIVGDVTLKEIMPKLQRAFVGLKPVIR